MKRICYIVAMEAEAMPFVERYSMEDAGNLGSIPCRLFTAETGGIMLYVVTTGKVHGSDLVGCEAAAVATLAALREIRPDIVINSGTCGAFASRGASIGKVYIGSGAMFHDRRVPGDDEFFTQSLGNYPVWEGSAALASALGFDTGKVTTGSSLDMQPSDLEIIRRNGGELKDMEGASVGFVCSLLNVPVLYVKSVTDLCDGPAETYEEFTKNLSQASEALRDANVKIIGYLSGLFSDKTENPQ